MMLMPLGKPLLAMRGCHFVIARAPELHQFFFQGLDFCLFWRSGCCCCSCRCRCCSRFCHCYRRHCFRIYRVISFLVSSRTVSLKRMSFLSLCSTPKTRTVDLVALLLLGRRNGTCPGSEDAALTQLWNPDMWGMENLWR